MSEIHYALLAIHAAVGFSLVFLAMKAFKKTKYPPMALLALGLGLIVFGDTIMGDILSFLEESILAEIIEEGIEIAGFMVLILAVKRS